MLSTSKILLLEKIIHLGNRLEKTRIYELLEPWSFNGYDVIEVQNAGKIISSFIGLPNLIFIINYTQQEKNTAGHIELNNNNNEGVFIEIDEKFKSDNEVILAILAHEICHKLIHINGLSQFGFENEILTDVATVYTGLGKLSLNGCKTSRISIDTRWNGNEQKTTTTTTTQNVGYLNRDQFAFIYNVICNMRRIPREFAVKGLNNDALAAITINQYDHNEELFYNDYAIAKVKDALNQYYQQYHLVSARNTQLIKLLQSNFESVIEANKSIHKKINSTNEKFLTKASEILHPERLNYIKNLMLVNELYNQNGIFNNEINNFSILNCAFYNLLLKLDGKFLVNLNNREMLYNINCPICENIMRLNQDRLVKIKCTKCRYSFIVDNSVIDNQESIINEKKIKKPLKRKIKEIIDILKQ